MADDSPRIHAPEFRGAVDWFNVAAPLTLKSLRGKVVLLDFWTYGCINCMHILPDLRRLEEKYRDELVVIGIHSAKFTNERKSDNIRRILVRYDIDHPVANDANFAIWKEYGARAWPSQVLIDPDGYVVAAASGEGHADGFDRAIAAVIQVFDEQGKINRAPIALSPERDRSQSSPLAFPGKVLADEASRRLFVADSNHHRVLVAGLDGQVSTIIGSGRAGFEDGAPAEASFFRPQGMALDGETLFVADTWNHAVRAVDLASGIVTTLAGTGRMGHYSSAGGAARETSLNSPWDVQVADGILWIAMAGTHQIWLADIARRLVLPYAGSGREAKVDGAIAEAAFAQPSGLARIGETLFAADAESNVIRAVAMPPVNTVRTIAGGDLFDFGDADGRGDAARFQHPLGITAAGSRLFVADTYNHRIRVVDPAAGEVRTFAGAGEQGEVDGTRAGAHFHEPGGLSATSDAIFVADTNNHVIRRVGLNADRVETVPIVLPAGI